MDAESTNQRLSRISTQWTLLNQAHAGPADAATAARRELMLRYCGAVYHYLLGATRDEDAALELTQEFFLRFLQGAFHRADPERGRFRDYVKTVLIHLVTDYHQDQRARPQALPEDLAAPAVPAPEAADPDAAFLQAWREDLLRRTWEALAAHATLHAVLLLHVQQPDLPSPDLADQLTARLNKPFTAGHVRVALHRAREKFADLLLAEVAHSLGTPTDAQLVRELRDLDLLRFCNRSLERRRKG